MKRQLYSHRLARKRAFKFRWFHPIHHYMTVPSKLEFWTPNEATKYGETSGDICGVNLGNGHSCTENGTCLMQFSGMQDEDGKDIYEADILEDEHGRDLVEFKNGAFCIGEISFPQMKQKDGRLLGFKVCGNLLQHSHLLPEEKR